MQLGGPLWTIRTHDTRDWAQRQPRCHDFLAHRHGLLKDGWWNLHCRLVLDHPPGFGPGPGIADVWGVFVRVTACTTMHWFISYFVHTRGPQSWVLDGAGVQAHDVPIAAILTKSER